MDLELLIRACWRHKLRLAAAALIGSVLFTAIGVLLIKPKYTSNADLSVVPIITSDSGNPVSIYLQNPDRYVDTQVEVLNSRQAAAAVAKKLGLTTAQVQESLTVTQQGKSDVVRVVSTTGDPDTSAKIAQQIVNDYLTAETNQTKAEYTDRLASINSQQAKLTTQIADLKENIRASGASSTEAGLLQQQLADLYSKSTTLTRAADDLQAQIETQPSSAQLVSSAAANTQSVGLGKKTLFIYGAALGLAIAFSIIAVANRPGQTLDDLDGADEFDGTPMLGVISSSRRLNLPGLPAPPPIEDLRNMAVADELTNIVQLKGAVQFIVVGPPADTRRIKKSLAPFVFGPSLPGEVNVENGPIHPRRRPADVGEFTVLSLATFLPGQLAPGYVVVGVDLGRVSRPQLEDVLSGLAGIGAEVLGIVGIR